MNLVCCDSSHLDSIRAIFNEAILNSTALYDYKPRTPEMIAAWFEAKIKGNYPVIGILAGDGELMGFGTYGAFRPHPAYKYSVEHSIYAAAPYRGRGIGTRLLGELIARARAQDYHVLIGAIDSQNAVSVNLHKRFGFQHCGTVRQAGYKFGRWLDLDFYQLVLETPAQPVEG